MSVTTDATAKAKSTASKATTTAKSTASKAASTVSNAKATAPTATEARKPFYAYVGLADLAVETAKTLPTVVPAEFAKFSEQVKTLPATLPAQLQAQVKSIPTAVLTLPATVKTLQDKGIELYGELAVRGEKVVTAIRNQPSTELVTKAATATVRNAKATVKSATKTLKATEAAAEDASAKIG